MADKEDRVERSELALFCRQFGGMLNAGVDLLSLLEVLRKQTSNTKLGEVMESVEKDVSLGRLLSTAFGRFPEVFSPFFLSMIRQGERDDVLDEAFVRVAEHYEREGDGGWGETGDRVLVRSEVDFSLQRLWPLLFWQAIGSAIVCVAIAGLWYATRAGTFSMDSLGPNVLLLIGLLILLMALIFARFGPVKAASCSFCGQTPDVNDALIMGRGAAICHDCVARNHLFLALGAPQEEQEQAEPTEELIQEPEEEVVEIEEDIPEESDFEIIKPSESEGEFL